MRYAISAPVKAWTRSKLCSSYNMKLLYIGLDKVIIRPKLDSHLGYGRSRGGEKVGTFLIRADGGNHVSVKPLLRKTSAKTVFLEIALY